jgi:phage terminase large subunit
MMRGVVISRAGLGERMYNLTDRQTEAWRAIQSSDVIDLLYGGAKGGGKSWFFCFCIFMLAIDIYNKFELGQDGRIYHVGWMGRKQATDFTATTLQTWEDVVPKEYYEIRGATDRSPKHVLIKGCVAIDFGGLDHREDINKFNSAEYGFIAIDQAEETTRDDVAFLRGSRRLKIKNRPLDYKGIFTANPSQCWLKEDFIVNPRPGCRFIQALPSDNPNLPDTYLETLRESFGHRPELLEAYLYGSWNSLEGSDQVIKDIWVRDSQTRELLFTSRRPRVVCDPARFGDDETVIYYGMTTDVLEQVILGKSSTVETARQLIKISVSHGRCPIVVEEDGIGGGVIDVLNDMGHSPIVFKAAGASNNPERYGNNRSEAWTEMSKKFAEERVSFKHDCMSRNDITKLIGQLTCVKYKFRSGRTYIEAKEDIKARLGGSPDRADAYNLYLWSYDRVPSLEEDTPCDELNEDRSETYSWETCL